ncbi:MAG: hypothetical protein Q9M48_04720 [Rhodobacterales bacterium]|nr:hypothetical protein [Rhodobacterales bacterium]
MRFLILIFGLLPTFAQAQSVTVTPETTLSQVDADLNNDGIIDRAILLRLKESEDASLIIWNGPDFVQPAVSTDDIIWAGGLGQIPHLQLAENGSLQIVSMNISIGRDRWEQTLTIAYRKGRYLLAGFTYDWYDTLDLENSGSCDVNLFNGKGFLTLGQAGREHKIRVALRAMPIADWDAIEPRECFDQ